MCIIADYHLHSSHSGDSSTPMESQIRTAIDRGLQYMCFTDHYDPDFPYDHNPDVQPNTFELDYDTYRSEYLDLRDRYKGRIEIFFGLEIGLQPQLGDYFRSYFRKHTDFDFIIGSNHLCAKFDPYYPVMLDHMTEREALTLYFDETLSKIRSFPDIDSYGHLDYITRYLPHREQIYSYSSFADRIDPILQELINRGIALEINTSPLIKGMRYFNPLPDILVRYREMGGDLITVGSDAHVPEKIAGCFGQTAEILRSLGFTHYAVYKERKPQMLPL